MDISLLLVAIGKLIWWLLPLIGSLACLYLAWRITRYLFLASRCHSKGFFNRLPSIFPHSKSIQDAVKTRQNQNYKSND